MSRRSKPMSGMEKLAVAKSEMNFMAKRTVSASIGDSISKTKGDGIQYFRRLKLKEVAIIPRPSCLPEDPNRKSVREDEAEYDDGPDDSYDWSEKKGRTRRRKIEPLEVIIPLANDRMKTAEIRKSLKTEYAARFLEKLGASPTPANLNLVWKLMPLEKCRITQVFHPGLSKNEKRNYISIRPNYNIRKSGVDRLEVGEVEDLNPIPIERLPIAPVEEVVEEEDEEASKDGDIIGRGAKFVSSFQEYKERFLFPYNLPPKYSPEMAKGSPSKDKGKVSPLVSESSRSNLTGSLKGKLSSILNRASSIEEVESEADGRSSEGSSQILSPIGGSKSDRLASAGDVEAKIRDLVGEGNMRTQVHDAILDRLMEIHNAASGRNLGALKQPDGTAGPKKAATVVDLKEQSKVASKETEGVDGNVEGQGLSKEGGVGSVAGILHGTYSKADINMEPSNAMELAMIAKEIEQAPSMGLREIMDIQASFGEKFPFEKYWGRQAAPGGILEKRIAALLEEIKTERFASYIKGWTEFMYWTFVSPEPPPPSSARAGREDSQLHPIEEQFLVVYEDLVRTLGRRRLRQHHALDLPFLMLALRIGVDTVLRASFPMWTAGSNEGTAALKQVDQLITTLLDPMHYLSHLPPIEACPQALKTLHNKRVPDHAPLTFTSPMIRFIVGNPRSNQAKLLLKSAHGNDGSSSLIELKQVLSAALVPRLLTIRKNAWGAL